MKILILSCYMGEGHNSAARAMDEAFKRNGAESKIIDPLLFKSKRASKVASACYNNLIKKTPKLFGVVYKIGSAYSRSGIKSPVYFLNSRYSEKLLKYIEDNGYDAVLSTHVFGMEAVTAINKKSDRKIPNYGVMTDYTNIPFFTESVLDNYFVPHEKVKIELHELGVDDNLIIASGIPVAHKFNERLSKSEAREKLGMPDNKKIFVLMSGGVGCENIIKLCRQFLKSENDDFKLYVLIGRNENLRNKLSEKFTGDDRLVPVSFTKEVNVYMNAADALITKPGGLSSTEAAVANVPIVHYGEIPGCESKNVRFFTANGMSVWAKSKKNAVRLANKLASNKKLAEKMLSKQRQVINENAADDIARFVINNGN